MGIKTQPSCAHWRKLGHKTSGRYWVHDERLAGALQFDCHMDESDDSAWTVIQR
jgi:hypothetical protein